MRDFLFNSEELLDKNALSCLEKEVIPGILPCTWVRWNNMIQLVYFTDSLSRVSELSEELDLDDLRAIGSEILNFVIRLEGQMDLSLENVVWDLDTVYLDEFYQAQIICLPAVLPVEVLDSKIYIKRVYALLEDLFRLKPEGEFVRRQIDAQQEKDPTDWEALREAMERREPVDDESIMLRGINTPEPVSFRVGHEDFLIGSDETVDGYLNYLSISPSHALIGWNEISFFIQDLESEKGTFLNDVQLPQNSPVPFGRGSILKFGDYTFNVE